MATNIASPKVTCPNKKVEEKEEEQDITKHQIKFLIQDKTGKPLPNITLQVTLPDNSVMEKTSNEKGLIEIKNIEPGNCIVKSDWKEYKVDEVVIIQ